MSDERRTQEQPDSRSFEERVFARFDALDARLGGIDERLNGMDERLNGVDERLQSLEAKQYDTKPIWERALAEIADLREALEKSRAESQAGFRKLERQLGTLSVDMLETRGTVSDLESRMDKIDKSPV